MKRIFVLPVLLIAALVFAACAPAPVEEPVAEEEVVEEEAPAEEEVAAEEEMEDEGEMASIAEIAAGDENFSTLVTALDAAGLVDTFAGEGEFTVFAPTNDAFAALPEGTVEGLLEDPEGALTDILTYHVVAGKVMAETVVGLDSATTLNGADVAISVVDGAVYLNETVQVVTTDIEASNGVIHVIDSVLLPPSMMEDSAEDLPTIAEIAAGDENFSTLVTALDAAGLVDTFAGEGEFTVFAPTNAAFEAMDPATLEAALADPNGLLTDVLTYHVVAGTYMAEDVVAASNFVTLYNDIIEISVEGESVFINGDVQIVTTDIQASNGVIHVIDSVLLPPERETIAAIAAGNEDFSTLVTALDAAGLVDTFAGEGEFTVFAPTNAAFEAMDPATLEAALADPNGLLTQVLTYHVVDGKVWAQDVVALEAAPTLQGSDIAISVTDEGVFLNDSVQVVVTNIPASNGVIHVIDMVLLPPTE